MDSHFRGNDAASERRHLANVTASHVGLRLTAAAARRITSGYCGKREKLRVRGTGPFGIHSSYFGRNRCEVPHPEREPEDRRGNPYCCGRAFIGCATLDLLSPVAQLLTG